MGDQYVSDYMTRNLITFTPETPIDDAIATILKHRISGAPVVDDLGKLVGMLSETDCIKTLMDGPYNNLPGGNGMVSNYMTRNVTTIGSNETILDLAYKFLNSAFRRFPVVDKGRLVGQISRSDILKVILKHKPKLAHSPSSWRGREPKDKGA
ncbi:MAG: CBS domain-containing protein [Saprospiraceae bacterium]|nr:CBS domain-containing protein [Saprospiraceae bacterium]